MTVSAAERRQQTIIGMLTVAITAILLIVCGAALYRSMSGRHFATTGAPQSEQAAYETLRKVKVKPSLADDQGGILIAKNGYVRTASPRQPSQSTIVAGKWTAAI
ncbi:hypothetical protein [Bifidobacterium simiarum]|uniref:Uncharacterized protein n=1 Tax=Bifidobacterium simiarum TaxID=2045441 RepID=A0A2M9HHF6_9BIFI|nr:hypothetical protein [Bifidobacterium simiarum]MBT1165258.1 hypothetical protein [Bifidobacterium simiarum]PJM76211.1 hypothetical protein CSQ87_01480 [Bifidobacterium simiarum]